MECRAAPSRVPTARAMNAQQNDRSCRWPAGNLPPVVAYPSGRAAMNEWTPIAAAAAADLGIGRAGTAKHLT